MPPVRARTRRGAAMLLAATLGLPLAARAGSDGHAGAADHAPPAASVKHAAPKADAKAETKAEAKAAAAAKPHDSVPAKAPAQGELPARKAVSAAESLQHLQERLAARLGAKNASEPGNEGLVVRVAARSPAPAAHAAAPAAPPRPRPAAAAHAHAAAAHWSYDNEGGPSVWGQLKPEFSTCAVGKRQSPIDIRDGMKLSLDAVQFDYRPTAFKVQDNGHTIQVNLSPGNSIETMGERYELLQFHFHRPSEESIDGRRFDMVAHFVHKSLAGRLAVVAVLLERGAAQEQLQQVWNNLPLEKGDTTNARGTLDLTRMLPEQRGYYTYMGSLTTPPCSEGVLWMVMKQPVQVSQDQIGAFARLYPMNARPIQSASGRLIKESN